MNLGSKRQKELIEKLYQLIEYELNKPEAETDSDLIAECAEYLEELQAGEIEFSDEEILSRLEAIKAQAAAETSLPTSEPEKKPHEKKRPQFRMIFFPIAATFLALVLAVTIVGCENWTTIGRFFSENFKKIATLSKGDQIENDDFSATKTEVSIYQSLEEYVDSQETISFLFPQPLPDGIKVNKIQHNQTNKNHFIIIFTFDNQDLEIQIKNYYQMGPEMGGYEEIIHTDKMPFYVYSIDGRYQITGQYQDYEYNFISTNYELLKQLLENIKEIET